MRELAQGFYKVEFIAGGEYADQEYLEGEKFRAEYPVEVIAGGAAGSNAALTGPGKISGRVTAASGGAGVAGVTVNVLADGKSETVVGHATSAANGDYSVTGLSAGRYELRFLPTAGNYLPQYYSGTTGGTEHFSESITVAVKDAATTEPVNAVLANAGQISGSVTDAATHDALAGVTVTVFNSTFARVASAKTAADGTYTVSGLAGGSYEVEFEPTAGPDLPQYYSGRTSLGEASVVAVTAGSDSGGINAALQAPGGITGTVTSAASGKGVAGVEVEVYDSAHTYVAFTDTGAGGAYETGLPPGECQLEFVATGGYAVQYYKRRLLRWRRPRR